ARGLASRLLCLARAPGERADKIQCHAPGCDPAGPSRQQWALRQSPGPCRPAGAGTWRQPRPDRADDAPARYPRHHGIAAPCAHDRQPSRLADRTEPDRARLTASAPNRVWLADITYIPTAEGWLYLAAVMDLFSRKIVGWAMRDHMRVELVSAALTMAIQQRRPPAGLI